MGKTVWGAFHATISKYPYHTPYSKITLDVSMICLMPKVKWKRDASGKSAKWMSEREPKRNKLPMRFLNFPFTSATSTVCDCVCREFVVGYSVANLPRGMNAWSTILSTRRRLVSLRTKKMSVFMFIYANFIQKVKLFSYVTQALWECRTGTNNITNKITVLFTMEIRDLCVCIYKHVSMHVTKNEREREWVVRSNGKIETSWKSSEKPPCHGIIGSQNFYDLLRQHTTFLVFHRFKLQHRNNIWVDFGFVGKIVLHCKSIVKNGFSCFHLFIYIKINQIG